MLTFFEFPPAGYRHQSDFSWCLARMILRVCQLGLALSVVACYGVDVWHARKAGVPLDARWMLAVAVASLTGITVLAYALVLCPLNSEILFGWDCFIALIWVPVFGIFGAMWFPETMEKGLGKAEIRMYCAAWLDLLNMLAWMISSTLTAMMFNRGWRHRFGGIPLPPIRQIINMGIVGQEV